MYLSPHIKPQPHLITHRPTHLLEVLEELRLGRARVTQQEHVYIPADAVLCLLWVGGWVRGVGLALVSGHVWWVGLGVLAY